VSDRPSVPRWSPLFKEQEGYEDAYALEEDDAQRLSRGDSHRTPGSGRLGVYDLDSEVDDFKTDTKLVGQNKDGSYNNRNGYRIDRDFWLYRIRMANATGHNFREAISFIWPAGSGEGAQKLHLSVVEASVFEEIYHGYQDFLAFMKGEKSEDELREQYGKKQEVILPPWARKD
jgi:hypothetical protein